MQTILVETYNKLIYLSRNKRLYSSMNSSDTFYDRLIIFFLHFSFYLKNFKSNKNKQILQSIYDYNFRQLELSIRELGYGDQSINKKMKIYINNFHDILSNIHFWDKLTCQKKRVIFNSYLPNFKNLEDIIKYFDDFNEDLSKNTLNNFSKSVIK